MLTISKEHIKSDINPDAKVYLYGQELNPQTYAIAKSDILIKGENADLIKGGSGEHSEDSTLSNDQFYDKEGRPGAEFAFTPVVPYYLHDPSTTFTDVEFEIVEAWWDLNVADRGPYPFAPPTTARKIDPASATLDEDENPFPESSPFTEIGDSE